MAGIGFELKRLFGKKTLSSKISAVMYSTFSTVGHLLAVVITLIVIRIFISASGLDDSDVELYFPIVLYAFVFPLIFTSGINIVLSRYLADTMWNGDTDDILASLYGIIPLYLLISAPPYIVFLCVAKMGLALSICAYLLYALVGLVFIIMVYSSAIKDYRHITIYFVVGMVVTISLSYLCIREFEIKLALVLTASFCIGMLIIVVGLFFEIKKYFHHSSNKYFDYLRYIKKYPSLFWGNTFYTIGLYIQNFVFWLYIPTRTTVGAYIFSEDFDFATYLAVLTIMPSIVMFVVRMETSFYEHYRTYLRSINTLKGREIDAAKKSMKSIMWKEFFYVIDIQVIFTLVFIVLGVVYLPKLNVQANIVDMFPYLAVGFMLTYLMFVACTLIQYFENYRDSCTVMLLYMVLNCVFTITNVMLGQNYYGLGIIFAGAISLAVGIMYLKTTLDNVDYIVFCSQSLVSQNSYKVLDKLIPILNGEKEKQQ